MSEKTIETKVEVMLTELRIAKEDIREIKEAMKQEYISRQEFEPIKKIVYGLVSVILLGVIGALIKVVIVG